MTVRSVILGMISAAFVCSFCYFNDFVMRQTFLVGNYMPISVYGGLLVFILFVNPVLLWMSKRLALSGGELAVIVVLTLAACYVPGRGLMHYFTTFLMMPHHYKRTNPGWKEHQIVDRPPKFMLAGVPPTYRAEDVKDALAFYFKLTEEGPKAKPSPSRFVWQRLSEDIQARVREGRAAAQQDLARHQKLAKALNGILRSRDFYQDDDFEEIELSTRAKALLEKKNDAVPAWPLDAIRDPLIGLLLAARAGGEDVPSKKAPRWVRDRIEARKGLSDDEVLQLHREALEAAFPKTVGTRRRGVYRLEAKDILDWPAFCARLRRQARWRKRTPGKRIWELLSEEHRAVADAILASARHARTRNAQAASALNELLKQPDLYREPAFQEVALPTEAEELRARIWDESRAAELLAHAWDLLAADRGAMARARGAIAMDELLERAANALSDEERQRLNRHLLDAAFPEGLRSISATEDYVLNGFLQGLGVGREHISLSQIPWYAWTRTLCFWIPLLLTFSIGVIGLALVVHRQWSDHEHLPYPIITFAHALLPQKGEARGGIFRNRIFWLGAIIVFVIHANNYACGWWPQYLIQIPRRFDFMVLRDVLPRLHDPGHLLNPTLSFTALGFAYFLATDVSLAVGLAPFAYEWVAGLFAVYGVSLAGGGFLALQIRTFLYGGAYFGMFLVLLYTGRHYYRSVFRRSLFLPARDDVPTQAVWGARVFLVGMALFVAQLLVIGLPWYLALIYTAGAVLIFTVISRIVAETGVFFIHAYHFPCVLLVGFLGARAIGPQAMLVMFMVTALLLIDPREAVMPFFVQGLKLLDLNNVKLGRTAVAGSFALVLAFAVAVPVTLFWQYDKGVNRVADGWTRGVPRMAYDATVRSMERLEAQGTLAEAGKQKGLAWVRSISPTKECVIAFGATFALVLLFSAGRLRFPRWPVHPVMFLVLGTFQSRTLAVSFLLGWFVKRGVTKYGGAATYQRLKPLMIGIIAGDMLGGLFPMIVGAIYYWATGDPPRSFQILPL